MTSASRSGLAAVVLLSGCNAAVVGFPAAELAFDIPRVDPDSVLASCSADGSLFTAQFNATGRSPEALATIDARVFEQHTIRLLQSADTDFPVRYQLGPLRTDAVPEWVVPGESTSMSCSDRSRSSVALGILDGFGVAVECVQWVGSDAMVPDLEQPELTDLGCITRDL